MNLRLRLLLLFLLAALVPLGAFGYVVQSGLVQELEEDHGRQLETRVASARRRLEQMRAEDRRAVDALCTHDLVVDRLLLDLATGRFDPNAEQNLVTLLPPMMRGRRFDTLHLLDARGGGDRGRVLGAGHYPEQVGMRAPGLLDALTRAGERGFVTDVRVAGAGDAADTGDTDADDAEGLREQRTWLTGCTVSRDGAAVAVLGGRFLRDELGETLLGDVTPVTFRMVGGDGTDAPGQVVETFADANGDAVAALVGTIDEAPLRAEVEAMQKRSLVIAGVALGAALLMALLVTLSLLRPLRELEEATRRVAQGDLESQVTEPRGEMGRTMRAFNDMTKELAATRQKLLRAERIAAWREVARRIAHEIKNPLQPIQMEIETMRKLHARKHPSFDEEFEPSTSVILEEVRRLNEMVTEFSKFARLPRPKAEALELREVLEHVVSLHASGGAKVSLEAPEDRLIIRGDRGQLTQVFVNLVQNAADAAEGRHGATGGRVRVVLAPTEDGAEVRVEDDGPGIPPADRLKIFEPYFTTKAKGTGLGLAIVHRIVGDHGGAIDVDDGLDGGAAFVVALPRTGPPEEITASLSDTNLPLGRADATSPDGPSEPNP